TASGLPSSVRPSLATTGHSAYTPGGTTTVSPGFAASIAAWIVLVTGTSPARAAPGSAATATQRHAPTPPAIARRIATRSGRSNGFLPGAAPRGRRFPPRCRGRSAAADGPAQHTPCRAAVGRHSSPGPERADGGRTPGEC